MLSKTKQDKMIQKCRWNVTYVGLWVLCLAYVESVEWHKRHFSRESQSVHLRQQLGSRPVRVNDVVKQPARMLPWLLVINKTAHPSDDGQERINT